MSRKEAQVLGAMAAVGTAIIVPHGITSERWSEAHARLTVLGAVATVAAL